MDLCYTVLMLGVTFAVDFRTIKRCVEREKAATPTVERGAISDDVMMSGYDGDQEDEDSFMDNAGE